MVVNGCTFYGSVRSGVSSSAASWYRPLPRSSRANSASTSRRKLRRLLASSSPISPSRVSTPDLQKEAGCVAPSVTRSSKLLSTVDVPHLGTGGPECCLEKDRVCALSHQVVWRADDRCGRLRNAKPVKQRTEGRFALHLFEGCKIGPARPPRLRASDAARQRIDTPARARE